MRKGFAWGLCAACCVCGAVAQAAEAEFSVEPYWVRTQVGEPDFSFSMLVHADGWQVCGQTRGKGVAYYTPPPADGRHVFEIAVPGGPVSNFVGTAEVRATKDGGASVAYRATPLQSGKVATVSVQGFLKPDGFDGGRVVADGRAQGLPGEQRRDVSGKARRLRIESVDGRRFLDLAFADSQRFAVMRKPGGPYYTVRLMAAACENVVSGRTYSVAFDLHSHVPLVNADAPWTTAAGADFVPLTVKPDIIPGSILDFSSLADRSPCDKYGRLRVQGSRFERTDRPGERMRFVGINLHSYACYHTMDEARLLVDRFVKYGYNAVRFHNYENEFMGLTKGSPDEATPVEPQFEGLDNLVEACRERGLFVTIDLHIGRNVSFRRLGIDKPGKTGDAFKGEIKGLYLTNEKAKENFKTFVRGFMNHVNRHTGRRYADEPTLALVSVVNESACGWGRCFGNAFDPCALEYDFMREMRRFIREELKSDVPLTSNNSSPVFCLQASREHDYDYVDDHFYYDHPAWPDNAKGTADGKLPLFTRNKRVFATGDELPRGALCTRMYGKPFVITEFNWCAPSLYRSYAGLLIGSFAALQDWDGLWRYLWSHSHDRALNPEKSNTCKIEITGDPLALAAERALMCLFLRGDLAPLKEKASVLIRPGELAIRKKGHPRVWHRNFTFPWAAWYVQFGTAMGRPPAGSRFDFPYPSGVTEPREQVERELRLGELKPGDGAVTIDRDGNGFTVATPKTCGGAAEQGTFAAGVLEADVRQEVTALWASAMDGKPLATSGRILLTHLPRMYNTGDRFADRNGKYIVKIGTLPYLVSRVSAEVKLAVENPSRLTVWALDTDGSRRAVVPSSVVGGKLVITCDTARDPSNATYLYELAER